RRQAVRNQRSRRVSDSGRSGRAGGKGGRTARRFGMNTRARVLEALSEVHDPELDEPITSLGFVTSCEVSPDGDVEILLRLPTPQCAPNFAFLMAADARDVVHRLPGVRDVAVVLDDHYTGEEINVAVGQGLGFSSAFPGESHNDDLDALRELFQRKALVAR